MSEIDYSLLGDFIVEAVEHLEEMESKLLELEVGKDNSEVFNDIFRPIHTIKGASQFVGLDRVSRLSHRLEDLLDLLRQNELQTSQPIIDTLIEGRDRIVQLVNDLENNQTEDTDVEDLVVQVTQLIEGGGVTEEDDDNEISTDELIAGAINELTNGDEATEEEDAFDEPAVAELADTADFDDTVAEAGDTSDFDDYAEEEAPAEEVYQSLDYQALAEDISGEEEYDKELFEIFKEQLKDKFTILRMLSSAIFGSDEKRELLDECQNHLEKLKYSANYMGYEALKAFYQEWQEEMDAILGSEGPVSDEQVFFMEERLSGLEQAFPHLLNGVETEMVGGDDEFEAAPAGAPAGMMDDDDEEELEPDVVQDFVNEATDHLEAMEAALLRLQDTPEESEELLDEIFRAAHTIKGAGQFVGLLKTSTVAHRLEDLLGLLRQGEQAVTSNVIGLLITGRDLLSDLIGDLTREQREIIDIGAFVNQIETYMEFGEPEAADEAPGTISEELSEHAVQVEEPAPESTAVVGDDDDALVLRLTEALNGADGDRKGEEYETLHGVFEEMLGGSTAFTTTSRAPEKSTTPEAPAVKSPPKTSAPKATAPVKAPTKAPVVEAPSSAEPEDELSVESKAEKPLAQERAAAKKPTVEPSENDKPAKDEATPAGKGKGDKVFKKSVRVDADKIDSLMNQVGELIVDRSYFFQIYNEMRGLQQHFKEELGLDSKELKHVRTFTYRLGEAIASLSRTSNELQEGVMRVRMLPISQLFNRYPRLIHDLTNKTSKKVNLVIKGEDTELDKMIVEELSDPLIHIIRNAVDHGLETMDERLRQGKAEVGTLVIEAYQESNHIVIEVTDDGRGINLERIKAKALERKLHNKDELNRMSERDVTRLVMQAGFSTAEKISRTSGRGVGMDVVKKNIEKLNGTIEIDSMQGQSTQIRLKIPLTLAIIPALLVRVGSDSFTIPLSNVEETLRISEAETSTIEGTEVIHMRGRTMPIFRLANIFSGVNDLSDFAKSFVVVVNTGSEQVGLVVDELIGQDEVVIKPLVDYLQEKSGFSGATIIGDGRISLILDIYELVNMTATKQMKKIKEREINRKLAMQDKKGSVVASVR